MAQQPSHASTRHQPAPPKVPRPPRLKFVAAVRFASGARQMFEVSNAHSADEARRMVLEEIEGVASLVLAQR